MPFLLDPLSFGIGFAVATVLWWLVGRMRPLWSQLRMSLKEQRETVKTRRSTGLEENHRRIILRRAQGMHLAAPLFSLDEIIQEPRLIAPPPRVEPGVTPIPEDIIAQTLPYMPAWPELAAVYRAPTLSLAEAVSGSAHLVIIGPAGIGKTVSLAHLASLAANRKVQWETGNEAIPFLHHVADLRLPHDGSKDPVNIVIEAASEHAPVFDLARLPGFIQTSFKNGQALLIVDGYDELDPQSQKQVVDWFRALLQAYPKTHLVTTGKIDQLDGLIGLGFNPLAVIGWDPRAASRFIQQWGAAWTQTVAKETWAQTGSGQVDPVLLDAWLAMGNHGLTPFELTLKVWGAYAGDSLGPRVLDSIATHVRRLAPSGIQVAALELLAMQVVLTSQPIFDPRKAREWVKQYDIIDDKPIESAETITKTPEEAVPLTESQKIRIKKSKADVAVPTSGLLGRLANSGLLLLYTNNKMRFLHPVFCGYLAGQAIGDNDSSLALMAIPEWDGKTLALHYLAARGDASAVADYLVKQSDLPLHQHLLTTAHWLRDAPREAAWRGKVFTGLANLIQSEGLPMGLRGQAMAAFAVSGDSGAAALFRQLMQSTSFNLIPLAALGSGAMRDAKAVGILEEVLQAPVGAVRRAACLALVAIGTNTALEVVARALLQGDDELRRAAAESLANDPIEGHAMLKDGATHSDIMLRRAVVHGLSRTDESWAIELMQRMQVEDDQWAVRNLATEYLERKNRVNPRIPRRLIIPSELPWLIEFAGKQGMGVPRGSPATEILVTAFKLGETEQRLAALPYLKRTPSEGIIGNLYNAMFGEDPEVREASFIAVAEIASSGFSLPHPNQFGLG